MADLEMNQISKSFSGVPVLKNVSLHAEIAFLEFIGSIKNRLYAVMRLYPIQPKICTKNIWLYWRKMESGLGISPSH